MLEFGFKRLLVGAGLLLFSSGCMRPPLDPSSNIAGSSTCAAPISTFRSDFCSVPAGSSSVLIRDHAQYIANSCAPTPPTTDPCDFGTQMLLFIRHTFQYCQGEQFSVVSVCNYYDRIEVTTLSAYPVTPPNPMCNSFATGSVGVVLAASNLPVTVIATTGTY